MALDSPRIARLTKAVNLDPRGQVFIVLVEPGFDAELSPNAIVLEGELLLSATSVSEALDRLEPGALTEIRFGNEPLPIEELRWLNQQREQLRREQTVVVRIPVEQSTRFAKYAPDVWRWATVLDLTTEGKREGLGVLRPVADKFEEMPYAPPIDPTTVVETPSHDLIDSGLEED